MAKTKQDKTKSPKLPKRVAGMKLPKEQRKKGDALLAKANSPAGQEVIAAGLTMAAAAATAAAARRRSVEGAAETSPDEPVRPGQPGTDPQVIADAIGNAADAVLSRLFGGKRAG